MMEDIIYLHYDDQIRHIVIVQYINGQGATLLDFIFPALICTQIAINGT